MIQVMRDDGEDQKALIFSVVDEPCFCTETVSPIVSPLGKGARGIFPANGNRIIFFYQS